MWKIKIGDRVRIRRDLSIDGSLYPNVAEEMLKYAGKIVTIYYVSPINRDYGIIYYKINEDGRFWSWGEYMLEPIKKKKPISFNKYKKGEEYV